MPVLQKIRISIVFNKDILCFQALGFHGSIVLQYVRTTNVATELGIAHLYICGNEQHLNTAAEIIKF